MRSSAAQLSFDDYQRSRYFGALDGIRGLSILLVLLHHVPELYPYVPDALAHNGRYGVAFFFVISGFLICTLLLRELRAAGRVNLLQFYGRRALRLLPLYYAALALQAILLGQYSEENQQLFWDKLPSYLLYFSNWLPTAAHGPFFFAWSLAVEEQFYLVFGLAFVFLPRRLVVFAGLIALLVKFSVYTLFGQVDAASTPLRILFSYEEPILWGVLLAFALESRKGYRWLAIFGHKFALSVVAILACGWLALHSMQSSSTWDAELLYFLMAAIVAGLVTRVPAVALSRGIVAHVGRVSYGIYLLHMFFISGVRRLPFGSNGFVCFCVSTVLVTIAASIIYRYFESPIIALSRRNLSPRKIPPEEQMGNAVASPVRSA